MKILVVDDHKMFCTGLQMMLQKKDLRAEVLTATSGAEAVKLAKKARPDVVIIDVAMPGMNGIETTRGVLEKVPDCKVVALSYHCNSSYIKGMFDAGATGYLLKDNIIEDVIMAIKTVLSGGVYFCPQVAKVVVDLPKDSEHKKTGKRAPSVLSRRERLIVTLTASGKSTKNIVEELRLSLSTVNLLKKGILKKLGIRNIAGITKYAVENGLIKE